MPIAGLRRDGLLSLLLVLAGGLMPAAPALAQSAKSAADLAVQQSEMIVWTGVVLMATGALGLFNFIAVKRIWGAERTAETPAYDFVGASSVLMVGWGCWLVIEHCLV